LVHSNAKRPSPQKEGEGLMSDRENRTAQHHKSHPARSSQAHSGPTSHHFRYVMERDAELRKSQDEAGVEKRGQAEHASSEIEGRLPHKHVRWFLHRQPPKRGQALQGKHAGTKVPLKVFYRLPHADQALFSSRLSAFFIDF